MTYQTIKDWPEEDRPREKLIDKGAQALTDTELLAIVLRNGNASTGETAIDQARALLEQVSTASKALIKPRSAKSPASKASAQPKRPSLRHRWKSPGGSAITLGKRPAAKIIRRCLSPFPGYPGKRKTRIFLRRAVKQQK